MLTTFSLLAQMSTQAESAMSRPACSWPPAIAFSSAPLSILGFYSIGLYRSDFERRRRSDSSAEPENEWIAGGVYKNRATHPRLREITLRYQ